MQARGDVGKDAIGSDADHIEPRPRPNSSRSLEMADAGHCRMWQQPRVPQIYYQILV